MYKPVNSWKQKSFIVAGYSTWYGRGENTYQYMKNLKDANVNLILPCDEPSMDSEIALLQILEEVGLPFLTSNKPAFCEKRIKSEQDFSEYVDKIKNLKNLYGFYIWDEPREGDYESIKHNQELVEKYAPGKATYVCLLPSYGPFYWEQEECSDNSSFCEYIDSFCEVSKPGILSNDYYPFHDEDTDLCIHDLWRDMGYLRLKSVEYDIPYWHVFQAVCDCTLHHYLFLTPERIEVQINCALAYGVKGVSYFFLHRIIVDDTGEKSEFYDQMSEINRKTINIGNELITAKSIAVYHGGISNDLTKKYYSDEIYCSKTIKNILDKLIIGEFKSESGDILLAIANKDYKNKVSGKIGLKSDKMVSLFDCTSSYTPLSDNASEIYIDINPGGILLFKIEG